MSTETAITEPFAAGETEPCANCGAPLAPGQRYCLECGARRVDVRSRFLDTTRPAAPSAAVVASEPAYAPPPPGRNTNAIIAGIGVLLLAMGVGVLIGRAGQGSTKTVAAAPPQVISVGGGGATTGAAFTDDWPSGTDGYTVQLQALPIASTQPSAVDAAKSAAAAKGAPGVGALKTDDFPGMTPGSYIVYSGVYSSRRQAQDALKKLSGKFPGASVVHVPASGGASSASGSSATGTPGQSQSPALSNLRSGSTKSYVQKSKALPKQLATGGAAPPTDKKAPGGGTGGGVSIG